MATDFEELNKQEVTPLYETDEARAVLNIVLEYDRQEQFVRLAATKKYRKHLHYWNNFQYIAWSDVAHDWRTAEDILTEDPQSDIDPSLYAKVINIYKAHGEILIGALTTGLPTVRFSPKDADDHEDVQTAKAKGKIVELIQRQNKAKLLLMKSLFILYNQGLVAAYNENKADFRFGSIKYPIFSDVPVVHQSSYCPSCGADFGSVTSPSPPTPDQAQPQSPQFQECPQCGQTVQPIQENIPGTQKQQTGEGKKPKNRECIEIYGPMNVKIPLWVRDQYSTPYLILETEEPVGMLREIYPEIADRIEATSYPDSYDKESRIPTAYKNDWPRNLATVQRTWLRPWALNLYAHSDEETKALKAKYPDGVYTVIINRSLIAELIGDKLDDHWTLSEHPLSEILHAEPIGATIVPIQDITNELANLTLETIEFGIPEIFADTRVLDFDNYQTQEARPGQINPASAPVGTNLSSGFHEIKASSLSREVEYFADRIEKAGQFVQGSYPSIYGGTGGGGGTAREYELSRAGALQRLTTTWTILQEWWAQVMGRATDSFIQNMEQDESYTQQKGGSYVNVWIRQAELGGETGDVEPETSEAFPYSWSQKRDVLMNLMGMKDPAVAAVIAHPENASMVASLVGLPEMYIPGDDDRNKQLYEIAQLIVSSPTPGLDGTGQMQSSVPITPVLDNNSIEAEICRAWLKSELGLDAKQSNPGGYANVLAHLQEHLQAQAVQIQTEMESQAQSQIPPIKEGPKPNDNNAQPTNP